jgi:hypothetical protein
MIRGLGGLDFQQQKKKKELIWCDQIKKLG